MGRRDERPRRRSLDRYRSENHAQSAELTFERDLCLPGDFVNVRSGNWNVRVLKHSSETWINNYHFHQFHVLLLRRE